MALKTIVLVRDGSHKLGCLTNESERDVRDLARQFGLRFAGENVCIRSSPSPQAMEVAKLIGLPLRLRSEVCADLWSSQGRLSLWKSGKIMRLVESLGESYDILILSTHQEVVDNFPTYWGEEKRFRIPAAHNTPRGTARVIDVATGTVEHVTSSLPPLPIARP